MRKKRYFIVALTMIVVCGLASYLNFKKFNKNSFPSLSFENLLKTEAPQTSEDSLFPEKEGEKEWLSPDGKLKLRYSQSWIEYDKILLEELKQNATSSLESEILLYAIRIKEEGKAFCFLTVEKINSKKNLEEIIGMLKKNSKEEFEIVDSQNEENSANLEFNTRIEEKTDFHSKMKMFFTEDKTYLITVSAPENDFEKFAEESSILSSAEFID